MIDNFQLNQEHTNDQQFVPETPEVDTTIQTQTDQTLQEETSKERNFRQLREKAERLERERDEALRYAQSLQAKKQESDDDLGLNDDDLVERKHVDKIVDRKIRQYEQKMQQYENHMAEQQVLSSRQDFHSVVSTENVDRLMVEEPEIAAALAAQTDIKAKAIATYNIIKKLGYVQPSAAPYSDDVARIQRNAAKPKPLASVNPQQGDSPLSRANAFANGLTPELQEELRKEMNSARRGY